MKVWINSLLFAAIAALTSARANEPLPRLPNDGVLFGEVVASAELVPTHETEIYGEKYVVKLVRVPGSIDQFWMMLRTVPTESYGKRTGDRYYTNVTMYPERGGGKQYAVESMGATIYPDGRVKRDYSWEFSLYDYRGVPTGPPKKNEILPRLGDWDLQFYRGPYTARHVAAGDFEDRYDPE